MQIATLLSTAYYCHRLVHPNEFDLIRIGDFEKCHIANIQQKEEHHVSVLGGHQIQCMVCMLCYACANLHIHKWMCVCMNLFHSLPLLGSQSRREQRR